MALDFGNKVENGGIPPNGVLPASEFNQLVAQVNKNEEDIAAIDEPNSIESIEATESQASGGNNVVTITETNGTETSFNVRNGNDGANGVSLGDVEIADNLTTDDATKVLSAKQGKVLKDLVDSQTFPIVNDLTTGGEESALSAEQGVVLKGMMTIRRTFINAAICAVGGYYDYQTSVVNATTYYRFCLIPIEGIERLDVTGCYQKAVHYFGADGTTKVGRTTLEVLTKADFPSGAVYCGWSYDKNTYLNISIDYVVNNVLANVGVSNMTDEKVIVPLIRTNIDSTTGEVIDGDSWLITPNLIPLCNAYGAYFDEGSNANVCFCYWYDKNQEYIKNTAGAKGDKAPEGACYMRFRVGGYTQGYTQATLHLYGSSITPQKIDDMELATTNISPRNLLNKKVAFLGDSITAQNAYCSHFGLISGAIISDLGVNGKCYSGGEIALQAANLVGDEEVVVMMGGTNDFNQSKLIGNIYDVSNGTITPTSDVTTFCGGLHKAINDIYTKCPTVQIVIITPPQKSNGWTANSASKYLYDYADAVKEVAKLYGIPVVDQFANCGINPVFAAMKTKYFNNDGTHPNDRYHWLLARWLYTALATWVKEHHV